MTDSSSSAWACCFCADAVDERSDEAFRVSLSKPGFNGGQQWMVHEACIARAVHGDAQFEPDIYWIGDP